MINEKLLNNFNSEKNIVDSIFSLACVDELTPRVTRFQFLDVPTLTTFFAYSRNSEFSRPTMFIILNRYRTELDNTSPGFFRATIFPGQKQTFTCFKLSIDPDLDRQYIIGDN